MSMFLIMNCQRSLPHRPSLYKTSAGIMPPVERACTYDKSVREGGGVFWVKHWNVRWKMIWHDSILFAKHTFMILYFCYIMIFYDFIFYDFIFYILILYFLYFVFYILICSHFLGRGGEGICGQGRRKTTGQGRPVHVKRKELELFIESPTSHLLWKLYI